MPCQSAGSLYGDVDPGVQVASSRWSSIVFETLPWMRYAARSQLIARETITRNHESQCQYHDCGNANNSIQLNSPGSLFWMDLEWTNPSCQVSQSPRSDSSTPQNKPLAVAIEVAQMQSNHSSTFVPKGHQGLSTSAHRRSFSEDQDLASRDTLTPQLSYTSTPDSLLSASNYGQSFRNGGDMVVRSNTIDGARGFMRGPEKATFAQYPEVVSYRHNTFKREFNGSPLDDWLSEPSPVHSWFESPNIQAAYSPQQTRFLHDQSLGQSAFSPHQPLNNDANLLSPDQAYAQQNNGMQQQSSAGGYEQPNLNDLFMLPPPSNEHNDPFYVDNSGFAAGYEQSSYNAHAHPFQGDFDFNNTSVYSTMPHAADYSSYDIPQAHNTLPTQTGTSAYTSQQQSQGRKRPKSSELDDLLLEWRAQGVTYKEIMKRGDWGLSESTLRGRYRTLTKDKRLRPRKPAWDDAAVSQSRHYISSELILIY